MLWTDNGTDFTIPFYYFFDDKYSTIVFPNGSRFTTVYPDISECFVDGSLPPDISTNTEAYYNRIKNEVKEHFYYRQISDESPQRFLAHFHATFRMNLYRWIRLIYSELQLKPEDAIYNYDLTEESSFENRATNTGSTSTENKNESNNKSNVTSSSSQFVSDTPDGSLTDIDNYMSTGGKNSSTDEKTDANSYTGTSSGSTTENGETSGASTLTRKGNIGVKTSAEVLTEYRNAMSWAAWDVIFNDLDKNFMGVF